MITSLHLSTDSRVVTWNNSGQAVRLAFGHKVLPYHIDYLNEVLVLADVWGAGERVFTIYHADGTVKTLPGLPPHPADVGGIYAIWYVQGQRKQTVVLFSDYYKPYDTACDFDLETYEFPNFHPTK